MGRHDQKKKIQMLYSLRFIHNHDLVHKKMTVDSFPYRSRSKMISLVQHFFQFSVVLGK